jgi:hypothetical protein
MKGFVDGAVQPNQPQQLAIFFAVFLLAWFPAGLVATFGRLRAGRGHFTYCIWLMTGVIGSVVAHGVDSLFTRPYLWGIVLSLGFKAWRYRHDRWQHDSTKTT